MRKEELAALLRRAEAEQGRWRRRLYIVLVALVAVSLLYAAMPRVAVGRAEGFEVRVTPRRYILEVRLLWVNYTVANRPINASYVSFHVFARGGVNETIAVLPYVENRDFRVNKVIRVPVNTSRLDVFLYDNATSRGLPSPVFYTVGPAAVALPRTKYTVSNYLYVALLELDLYIEGAEVAVSSPSPAKLELYVYTEDEGWVNTTVSLPAGSSSISIDESRVKKILYRAWLIENGLVRIRVIRGVKYFDPRQNTVLFAPFIAVLLVLLLYSSYNYYRWSRRTNKYRKKLGIKQ